MEINEDQPNENTQKLFTQSFPNKRVSYHYVCFGRDSGRVERKAFFVRLLAGEAVGRLTRSGHPL